MSDLRERVARAICDADWGEGHYDSGALSQLELTAYEIIADAAIAEMRPTIRDEALEEAAAVVLNWSLPTVQTPSMWLVDKHGIAAAIRAMKGDANV